MDDDDRPRGDAVKPKARPPICADCRGVGIVDVPRAFMSRSQGLAGTMTTPGKCPACKGTGKSGA